MLLRSIAPNTRVSPYARAGALFEAAPLWTDVDLVLLDLGLPDCQGLEALRRLRRLREDVPVVVLSGLGNRQTMLQCLDAGAMGYIPKSADSGTLEQALRHVLAGGVFLPADVGAATSALPPQLTPRQRDILGAVLQGKPIKRIALDLDISIATTKTHVSAVLRALDATTRTEAVIKAAQLGLQLGPSHAG